MQATLTAPPVTTADEMMAHLGIDVNIGLNAYNYTELADGRIMFLALIKPLSQKNRRLKARWMTVTLDPNPVDGTWTVAVRYDNHGLDDGVIHFYKRGLFWEQLPGLLAGLDHNGRDVINPRWDWSGDY